MSAPSSAPARAARTTASVPISENISSVRYIIISSGRPQREQDSTTEPPAVAELYLAVMEDIFQQNAGDRELELRRLDSRLKCLDEQMLKADKKYLEDAFDRESYDRVKRSFLAEKEKLE